MGSTPNLPLSHVTALDLGRYYQAPYAGFLLAMAGADVIKIESVAGEPLRSRMGGQTSYAQALLNSNKRNVTLNLKHARGRELLCELVRRADVLIENFAAGVMDRLGVGYERLRAENPRLIYASGTGFGLSGPDRDALALDPVMQAHAGIAAVTGEPGGPPIKAGPAIADFLGGTHLYGGIVTALLERERSGSGRLIEVALQEAVYPALATNLAALHYKGPQGVRTGNRHSALAPYDFYRARDGYIALLCTTEDQWRRLCAAMQRPDLLSDPRFASNRARVAHLEQTTAQVEAWTQQHSRAELFEQAKRAGVVAAAVRELDEVMRDAHMHERGMLVPTEHPELGPIVLPRSPIRYHGTELPALVPAALLGEHNANVYGEWLGLPAAELEKLQQEGVI
jgi:crotonobetainyl-CoA:carnitine CoA-transferase CaiB-like acyl-CoA transferase